MTDLAAPATAASTGAPSTNRAVVSAKTPILLSVVTLALAAVLILGRQVGDTTFRGVDDAPTSSRSLT